MLPDNDASSASTETRSAFGGEEGFDVLISIVPALLYLKMRQLGGEPLSAALAQIEESEDERSNWQQRMRTRLSLHTPTTSRSTGDRSIGS